jgi:hypothetical protein
LVPIEHNKNTHINNILNGRKDKKYTALALALASFPLCSLFHAGSSEQF